MPFSFSRKYRLASQADFQSVFLQSKKVSRPSQLVLYKPNHLPHARLGIVVGKRNVKKAVDRNGLRRIVRESFRHHQASLAGFDLIVMVKSARHLTRQRAWREELDNVWSAVK